MASVEKCNIAVKEEGEVEEKEDYRGVEEEEEVKEATGSAARNHLMS